MKQKHVLGIVALAMIALLGVNMVSAFGFGNGFMNSDLTEEEKTEMQEQREVMKTAIESGDYETWKSLMENRIAKMQEFIEDEDNFNNLVERHEKMSEFREAVEELKASGDFSREDIQDLREEYGIEDFGRMGKGFGMKKFGECPRLIK